MVGLFETIFFRVLGAVIVFWVWFEYPGVIIAWMDANLALIKVLNSSVGGDLGSKIESGIRFFSGETLLIFSEVGILFILFNLAIKRMFAKK